MAKRIKFTDHPDIVVLAGVPKLKVFEDFFVEEKLPKWTKVKERVVQKKKEELAKNGGRLPTMEELEMMTSSTAANGDTGDIGRMKEEDALKDAKYGLRRYVSGIHRMDSSGSPNKKKGFFERLFSRKPKEDPAEDVETTFQNVKDGMKSVTTEDLIKAKAVSEALVKKLSDAGQYRVAERIKNEKDVIVSEMVLAANDLATYITEEQVIDFLYRAAEGVRIEYLRFYDQILPEDVQKKKIEADGLMVFDNYVIMHYSKDVKKFEKYEEEYIEAERARRRDPILFGVIRGSRKLFKVCDWVTKDDDLTLAKVEKVLGISAPSVNVKDLVPGEIDLTRLVSHLQINIEKDIAEAQEKGLLISDRNLATFVKTGEVVHPDDPIPEDSKSVEQLVVPVAADQAPSAEPAAK